MKPNTNRKLLVGLFVCVAFLLLAVAVRFIGKKARLFSSTIKLHTVYKDINGLKAGGTVRFAGIDVGTVDNVTIMTDSTVRVDFLLDKHVQKFIKKDATSSISSDGLMGDKLLVISSGDAAQPEVSNGDYLPAGQANNIDAIMGQAKITMDNAAKITGDLAVISDNIKNGRGTLGKILMDRRFASNIDTTLKNAKEGIAGFRDNMEAAKSNFLLKGYYKKKEREAEKAKRDSINKGNTTKKL